MSIHTAAYEIGLLRWVLRDLRRTRLLVFCESNRRCRSSCWFSRRDTLSAALGPFDAAALQPLMAAFQTLRTWQQRLGAPSGTPNSNGHAAPSQANGHTDAAAQPNEFGADLTVHTSRLADDPDAAVLAMCGVSPGSPTGVDRCVLLQCYAAWPCPHMQHYQDLSSMSAIAASQDPPWLNGSMVIIWHNVSVAAVKRMQREHMTCLSAAREAEGQQPSVTSIRGMFADATRPSASYRPDEDEDEEDGYGPKRAKSKVSGRVMPLISPTTLCSRLLHTLALIPEDRCGERLRQDDCCAETYQRRLLLTIARASVQLVLMLTLIPTQLHLNLDPTLTIF